MLTTALAPYLLWAKTRRPAAIDLAGSNLLACTIDDLPGAREAVGITAPNDNGFAPLVDAIAAHYGVSADRVVTAAGCSGANFIAIAALVAPGDLVLIERPTYDPLTGACRLMGARVESIERRFDARWEFDLDELRRRLEARPRLLVLTQPHNPTGTILDAAALTAIGALAAEAGTVVLSDEVYLDGANLIGAGAPRHSPAATLDGPFISTSSLTKSYGLAGLRCGWIVASSEIAARLRRTRDIVDNAGNAPGDLLGAFAFQHLPSLAERSRRLLTSNIARARAFFQDHPELPLAHPPQASIVFPRIAGRADAEPFVQHLLERYGTAVAPGRFFDAPGHFRVSLAGDSTALQTGLSRIGEALVTFASK